MSLIGNVLGRRFAIDMLLELHERPGENLTYYAGSNKTKRDALDRLVDSGLAVYDDSPKQYNARTLNLTAEGDSIAVLLHVIQWHLVRMGKL